MVEEIDIYRSANLLIKQHGEEAAVFAAMQADACMDKGDLDGKVVWLAVIKAIEELQDATPPKHHPVKGNHSPSTHDSKRIFPQRLCEGCSGSLI